MLDNQDIKKIGEIVQESLKGTEKRINDRLVHLEGAEGRIIEAVGEMLEQNVMPVLDKLIGRVDKVEVKIDDMQKTIANLPDKDYLDTKIAGSSGEVVVREKKLDQKVNLVVDALDEQHIVPENRMAAIKAIHVFPPPPQIA